MASLVKRPNRPKPYIVYYFDEVGQRRGKSFFAYDDARKFKAEKELHTRRGTAPVMGLEAAATAFIQDKINLGGPLTTPERYHQALKQFIQLVGERPLHRVACGDVEKYKLDRMAAVTNRTTWNNLKIIKTFFNWCVRKKLLAESPARDVEQPKFKERIPRWPDDDDIAEILPKALAKNRQYYRLILLSAFAGMRRSEMVNLRREDCDFKSRIFRIQTTKSKDPRIVPMHQIVVDELTIELWDGWLFKSPDDPKKHVSLELTKDCCAWLRQSGFQYVLHAFRHSFASRVARIDGMTLETLQSLMGHTSVKMALHYMHSTSRQRAALIDQLKYPDPNIATPELTVYPTEKAV